MDLPYGKLKTTVIGSFPLQHSIENMQRALLDQIEAGINFPSVPQLLDMNLMFLEPLAKEGCGIEIRNGNAWIISDLKKPKKPIAVEFLEFTQEFLEKSDLLEKIDGVKIPVTGPITLSSVTKITEKNYAIEFSDFILKFSEIVAEIVRYYDEFGVELITIDEPALGYAIWLGTEEDVIIKAIDKPIEAIKRALPSVHVCGDIRTVANLLIKSKASILTHEFKALPKNLEVYSKEMLDGVDKMIGLGCVNSRPDPQLLLDIRDKKKNWIEAVEPVDEIEKFILEGAKRFGLERLVIVPDCGFGGMKEYFKDDTGQKIASQKLKNMVEAVRKIKELTFPM